MNAALQIYIFSMCALNQFISRSIHANQNCFLPTKEVIPGVLESVITKCFSEKDSSVFISENKNDIINGNTLTLLFSLLKPIYLFEIKNSAILKENQRFRKIYVINETYFSRRDIPAIEFIIDLSYNANLQLLLEELRNSIWWNHKALYLIFNTNSEIGCALAHTVLNTVWSFNILSALYICQLSMNELFLYTFNPYSNVGPKFWKNIQQNLSSNMYWSLFEYSIKNFEDFTTNLDPSHCKSLYFDKAKYLHGYPLKNVIFYSKNLINNITKNGYERYEDQAFQIYSVALKFMNATNTVKLTERPGGFDKYGHLTKPYGLITDVINGTADITSSGILLRDYWKHQPYPIYSVAIKMISLKSLSNQAWISVSNYSYLNLIYTCLGVALFLLMLKYILRQSLSDTFLVVISLILNQPIAKIRLNLQRKIIFITLSFTSFTIGASILSFFSAISIVPSTGRNIDSLSDILKYNSKLSGPPTYKDFIWDQKILEQYVSVSSAVSCLNLLYKGQRLTCLSSDVELYFIIKNTSLIHIARESLTERTVSFLTSEDFPLMYKINVAFSRMTEAGLIQLLIRPLISFNFISISDKDYDLLDIKDIIISFYILFSGWAIGLAVVIIEIVIYKLIIVLQNSPKIE